MTTVLSDLKSWLVTHPLSEHDATAVAALRSAVAPAKGVFDGVAGRERFDAIMRSVPAPKDVTFEDAVIGGTPGWWARTRSSPSNAAIIYIHGGWFTWGTAEAFRNVAGHIAVSAGIDTFVPDYRLAPENPFPAAVRDVEACYRELMEDGIEKIAILGDSAGGNLALVLLSIATTRARHHGIRPLCAVVFSPITDLALTGESYAGQADADLYFTKAEAAALALNYLGETNPTSSLASPLYGDLTGLPPVRVHVGGAEVLLDDSRHYVEKARAAGVDAELHVWEGMPHGFPLNIGQFDAGAKALESSGAFLAERLRKTAR
jgi:acetyl esterase/lipase